MDMVMKDLEKWEAGKEGETSSQIQHMQNRTVNMQRLLQQAEEEKEAAQQMVAENQEIYKDEINKVVRKYKRE